MIVYVAHNSLTGNRGPSNRGPSNRGYSSRGFLLLGGCYLAYDGDAVYALGFAKVGDSLDGSSGVGVKPQARGPLAQQQTREEPTQPLASTSKQGRRSLTGGLGG
ncbi:hypothetical protein V498_08172 [Pseudogymnoascus sp. VKM F-4517 (FW-2822)]|nr:hypothetical protein V498_08172 [Pseudogymnoascus sp. VKM F-4517 (FW-2822)]